jgi:hypothetical protein
LLLLVVLFVACRRCGCRMLTKVGRTTPMLICTDCGFPLDQRETATLSRQRLWGAVTLVAMALVGSAMLLLASIKEMRRAEFLESTAEHPTEAASQEGEKGEAGGLLEPSPLVDLYEPSDSRPGTPSASASETRAPINVSPESGAGSTQHRHQQKQP